MSETTTKTPTTRPPTAVTSCKFQYEERWYHVRQLWLGESKFYIVKLVRPSESGKWHMDLIKDHTRDGSTNEGWVRVEPKSAEGKSICDYLRCEA